MVTLEQVKNGLTQYIDAQIIPRISGAKRYAVMVYLALLSDQFASKATELMNTPALSMLHIMDDSGYVDIDRLRNAAYTSMVENIDVDIPVVGRFIFSRSDVDKLCDMIRRA